VSTSKWRSVSISRDCCCLRATICFCNCENSDFMISSLSLIAVSLTPSIKSRSLNLSVETSTEATGDIASALDKRGNKSLTAIIASTQVALSSLLSALKCSLFFVPVHTENLLSSDLFSLTEHTYTKYNMQIYYFNFESSVLDTPLFQTLHHIRHFCLYLYYHIHLRYKNILQYRKKKLFQTYQSRMKEILLFISLIIPTPPCY